MQLYFDHLLQERLVQLFERNTYSVVNIFDVTLRPQLNVTGMVEVIIAELEYACIMCGWYVIYLLWIVGVFLNKLCKPLKVQNSESSSIFF